MKKCPRCQTPYTDASLNYCQKDGCVLVESTSALYPADASTLKMLSPKPDIEPTVYAYRAVKKVPLGDYWDFEFLGRKFRITAKDLGSQPIINRMSSLLSYPVDMVLLYVNTGGGLIFGGDNTKQVSTNEFWVPAVRHIEEECSLYSYHFKGNRVLFFRVHVEHLDSFKKQVDLNVVVLAG